MPKRNIFLISCGLILIFIIGAMFFGRKPKPPEITLVVWGFDKREVFSEIFNNYKKLKPNVRIRYFQKSYSNYEKDLIDALASGKGPDVFFIKNTWLLKHKNKLAPMPQDLASFRDIKDAFVDVVLEDFSLKQKIYALPLSVDTLALYWNKDLFNNASIALPPKTWLEVEAATPRLTRTDVSGKIIQSAISMGTFSNIDNASKIILTLMLQKKENLFDLERKRFFFDKNVENVLDFYLQFSNPFSYYYTWNDEMHWSIDNFSENASAMMIDFFYQKKVIQEKSPFLNFSIAPLPQFSDKKLTLASYWGLATSITSKHPYLAWDLILYLVNNPSAEIYLKKTKKPPALRFLVNKYLNDPEIGVFCQQSLYAKSFPTKDEKELDNLMKEMIESLIKKKKSERDALEEFRKKIEKLYRNENY